MKKIVVSDSGYTAGGKISFFQKEQMLCLGKRARTLIGPLMDPDGTLYMYLPFVLVV